MKKYIKIIVLFCLSFSFCFFYWFYKHTQDNGCNNLMYEAIYKFENKEYKLAIEGDDNIIGFLKIIEKYKHINDDNLIYLYTGLCYSYLNDHENAIKFLSLYKTSNIPLMNSVYIHIGDLYCNLNNENKAIEYYNKVNNNDENKALALTKLMNIYVHNKNYLDARKVLYILKSSYHKTDVYKRFNKEQKQLDILFK